MESYEAIALCVGRNSEEHAKALELQATTVRKWKEDPIDGSGSRNPLDSVRVMIRTALKLGRETADAMAPIRYLQICFVDVLPVANVHEAYSDLLQEIAHLTQEHTAAIRDGRISMDERRRIQREVQHVAQLLQEYDQTIGEAAQ